MTDYLLCDTCVIIDFINHRSLTIHELLENNAILLINSIIEMELLQGARNKQELQVIKKKLLSFRLLNLEQAIFDSATQFVSDYSLSHGLALPDAVIASTAIYYQIPLFTYNQKDFRFLPDIQFSSV